MPVEKLRWIGGSHFEGDEFGALNEFLMVAPDATPFGAEIGVLTSLNDFASKPAHALRDGRGIPSRQAPTCGGYTRHTFHTDGTAEFSSTNRRRHCCVAIYLRSRARTPPPITESEILSASEGMRGMMDYYAHSNSTSVVLERLAALRPSMLACQHGSAYRGDCAALIRELAVRIETGSAISSAASMS